MADSSTPSFIGHPVLDLLAKAIVIFVGGLVGLTGLLTLAFALPKEPVQSTTVHSLGLLLQENTWNPDLGFGYNGIQDYWTDALMLNIASYDYPGTPLEAALADTLYGGYGDPFNHLVASLDGQPDNLAADSWNYQRYWHGYQLFLRPLLWAGFDYGMIRLINMIGEWGLVLAILFFLVWKKQQRWGVGPFCLFLVLISVWTLPFSLQFAPVTYIAFIVALLVVIHPTWLKKPENFALLLLATGMMTSFLDLLTFPLLTLGLPLGLYLFCYRAELSSLRRWWLLTLVLCIFWVIGYGGMWASKWLVASLILHTNVLADALEEMTFRLSNDTHVGHIAWSDIGEWIGYHYSYVYMPLAIILIGGFYGFMYGMLNYKINKEHKTDKNNKAHRHLLIQAAISYGIVAIMPWLWCSVLLNHSVYHHWMTYRILALTAFACCLWLAIAIVMQWDYLHPSPALPNKNRAIYDLGDDGVIEVEKEAVSNFRDKNHPNSKMPTLIRLTNNTIPNNWGDKASK